MKKAKIYKIATANNVHDGALVIAYSHAAALRCARRHVGTQLGGIPTRVTLVGPVTCANDYCTAYLVTYKF